MTIKLTKSGLKRKLAKGKCRVTFKKMDGEVRKMIATLSEDLIPEDSMPVGEGRAEVKGLIRAFDLERNGWRSFYVDRVRAFAENIK